MMLYYDKRGLVILKAYLEACRVYQQSKQLLAMG